MDLNQRPIPDAALRDKDAVEMLRVWIAERGLHCSIKVGMYREHRGRKGMGYSTDAARSLDKIREHFQEELDAPASEIRGGFLQRH